MSPEFPLSSIAGKAETYQFSGRGEVFSYTTVERDNAPEGYEDSAPYVAALIKLEEGPMMTAQLTDVESWVEKEIDGRTRLVREFDVYIGMPVEMVTRRLKTDGERGIIVYGNKFRPRFTNKIQSR